MQNQLTIRQIPSIMHDPWQSTISPVLHGFQSSEGGLDPLLQTYAPRYLLQSRCNPAVLHTFFPFSTIQHSHRDAYFQHSHRCFVSSTSPAEFSGCNSRYCLAMHYVISTLPWILQVFSKAIHAATFGFQGTTMTMFSASCRWPAQQKRLTMQVSCSYFAEII